MLTRPAELADVDVIEALRAGWVVEPAGVEYLAVGFGSHHWQVVDETGRRWFLSVDDLEERQRSTDVSRNDPYDRLRAALLTARAIEDGGATFAVAPVRTTDGDVVQRIQDRYVAALYPFIDGGLRDFGETFKDAERDHVLRLLGALHTSPAAISEVGQIEDFVLPQRAAIVDALDAMGTPWDTGPYGERARSWLTARARRIEQLLGDHDRLADQARQRPDRMVLTHGEPHPGNLIETADGWMLVDWDTALIAPPERDLWHLQGTAPSGFDAYIGITAGDVVLAMLDFYRLSWTLDDLASFAARFRRAHGDTEDAAAEWANMEDRIL